MLKKISKDEIKKYVFFLDNGRFHKSRELITF